ncbi:MAG: response regulator transcription factor [Candidatus Scatomorpha sp.]|jgi:two-component system response regulator YesN
MYSILIADDKEVFRRKLKRMNYFRENSEKFSIDFEARNGVEALEILKKNKVDVVLTDIRMPFIDGVELLKQINEKELCRCVLLLSEFADFNYAKEGILNGAFDYILKPVDENIISEAFDRVYKFINSVSRPQAAEISDVELLADSIISGERMDVIACANRIVTGHLLRSEDGHSLSMRIFLNKLQNQLVAKLPYLELYLSLPSTIEDFADIDPDSFVSGFTEQMLAVSDSVASLTVRTANPQVQEACLYILNNPDGKTDIGDIAKHLFTNRKYLSALMKRETGKSAIKYITHVKMERARNLLMDSDMNIGELAELLGFENADYFSKVFRKSAGVSPREFRRQRSEK